MNRSESQLQEHLWCLSQMLAKLTNAGKSLTDPAMISLSRQLDTLILEWHQESTQASPMK